MVSRALLVDVDGTLYRQAPVRLGMMFLLARAYALRPFEARKAMRALGAYRRAQESLRSAPSDLSVPLADRQLRYAIANQNITIEYLKEHTDRWMLTEPLALLRKARRRGTVESFAALRDRGWKLAAVSDYPARRKLEALNLAVDEIVCAQDPDVQHFKPSPAGIEAALRRLDVRPENAIYIGDREEVDGTAARAAHICSMILRPRELFPTADAITARLELGCSPDG